MKRWTEGVQMIRNIIKHVHPISESSSGYKTSQLTYTVEVSFFSWLGQCRLIVKFSFYMHPYSVLSALQTVTFLGWPPNPIHILNESPAYWITLAVMSKKLGPLTLIYWRTDFPKYLTKLTTVVCLKNFWLFNYSFWWWEQHHVIWYSYYI